MIDYQIHDVSEKQIKIAQWYLDHKKQVAKIPIFLLAIFSVGVLLYGLAGVALFLIKTPQEDKMLAVLTSNFLDFSGFKEKNKPLDLIITEPQVLYGGNQSYDFIAQVKNPNEKRGVVSLAFQFLSDNFESPEARVTILPNQSVYLLSLGNKSESRISKAALKIIETRWQSLWDKDLPEINISVGEPVFGSAPDNSRSWVSFESTNDSLRNIWNVDYQAVLYSGRRVVAANQITVEQLLTGETRKLEMSWFERLPKVTQIDIVPLVEIYNEDVFYTQPGEALSQ